MSGYCDFASGHEFHGPYHDTEYGFPITDENALFERLLLEINQAGLNWELILKRSDISSFHTITGIIMEESVPSSIKIPISYVIVLPTHPERRDPFLKEVRTA